ncbi:MAG: trypsin-like peptidase domain-containing protein [Xenococcus sp. MO_188.B8]|nr:trypsin-like peptidase domain-containing protein [Xenococcus sp. MO_188.B8]
MSNSHTNVQIQNLREFIVQIRHATSDKIVGTGFVVSLDGKIVTCKHVVRDANKEKRVTEGVEVGIYFPQVKDPNLKTHRASVVGCFSEYDDDVVLLQLIGDTLFLSSKQVAVLGTATQSYGNSFRSYGYKPLGEFRAGWVDGKILGHTELKPSSNKNLQVDFVELRTDTIRPGVSGAPVLDEQRNLVVGILAKRFNPGDNPGKYLQAGNAANVGWAVDTEVLSFFSMNLPLQEVFVSEIPASQPPSKLEQTKEKPLSQPGIKLNNAPPPLEEWVGRKEFLQDLDEDWQDSQRLITGLIGFGGEGKSSLTRRWLDDLLKNSSLPQPKGVFWWGFYENRSVDEFFEAVLTYLVKGIDPNSLPSAKVKAQVINAMLKSGRYLFVLDGLEVLQHQNGDDYGLLKNIDLRDWLRDFSAGEHESFCMISSRAPLLDLIDFTTYTHRDLERLSVDEGRDLLRKRKVVGTDAELEKVVQEWDGYALVLSLLGSYLVDRFEGKIEHLKDIPSPTADEPKYDRVRRVLRRYDEHLTDKEREFLEVFSAFRLPVPESALEPMFGQNSFQESSIVKQLVDYCILRYNSQAKHYTTHPLIRAHYLEHLQNNLTAAKPVHKRIADYYLNSSGETPENPTLDNLNPLIEAVYHLCQADDYDQAFKINWERINQYDNFLITQKLGAYETDLVLIQTFFPKGDTSQEPQVSTPKAKSWILNQVGLCLMNLGRMSEALPFYERSNAIAVSEEDWENAGKGYQNLAGLYVYLGKLTVSAEASSEALYLARRAENKKDESNSLADQGWVAHLQGDLETASSAFQRAQVLQREMKQNIPYLYSFWGILHANHLRRIGDPEYARQVTEINLEISNQEHSLTFISQCHRVLGDLDADAGNHDNAQFHYQEALKIAHSITDQPTLIEVFLCHGRWLAKRGEVAAARRDLDEALNYAVAGGYRIYEADIRVGLAWAHLAADNHSVAQKEAEKAKRMSEEMGYHWGQVDAQEVLERLETSP